MRCQHVFHFIRIDVEARHENHVLLAVHDAHMPIGIHLRDVARAEPAIGDGARAVLRRIQVTGGHLGPLHEQLAAFADAQVVAVCIDDPHLAAGHGQAHGARAGAPVGGLHDTMQVVSVMP